MKNLKSIALAVVALVSFSVNAQTKKVNVKKVTFTGLVKK